MTGSATHAADADVAASARARLDQAAEVIGGFEAAQRDAIAVLVGMWPTSAWRVAGCTSAKAWLCAYTSLSEAEAARLESVAGLCSARPALAEAVRSGVLSVARAYRLARAATRERIRYLDDACVAAFVNLAGKATTDDAAFGEAVRFWVSKVDEIVEPRRIPPHALYLNERLFGGGELHGWLSPASFARVAAGIDAFTQDPDPANSPYQRSLGERRADALDDLAAFAMTHGCHDDDLDCDDHDDWTDRDRGDCVRRDPDHHDDHHDGHDDVEDDLGADDPGDGDDDLAGHAGGGEGGHRAASTDDRASSNNHDDVDSANESRDSGQGEGQQGDWERCGAEPLVPAVDEDDVVDGLANVDELEAALEHPEVDDPLERLRLTIRRAEARRRRRRRRQVKPRAGACVNVHVDLPTLLGIRAIDDFDGLVMHGDGWSLCRAAVEELACDAGLVATLFSGPHHIIDANTTAERFNRRQRRAVAGRDRGCVFPGCTAHPRRCDLHHLDPRARGGPTVTLNAAMLCRFHHRLVHQHRWSLSIDPDGCWVATDPHGIEWKGRPTHQTAA